MVKTPKHTFFRYFYALVWVVNGLLCKIFNLVPRHQLIVERILKTDEPRLFTIIIGIAECFMGVWIILNYKQKLSAMLQIITIATMNIIEFILAPDLLLWGKFNALFAFLFILLIYYTEFKLFKQSAHLTHD